MEPVRHFATIERFNPARRFGALYWNGRRIMIRSKDLCPGERPLTAGDPISFELGTDKTPAALNIKHVDAKPVLPETEVWPPRNTVPLK